VLINVQYHWNYIRFRHKRNYAKAQQYFDKVLEGNPNHIACLHQKARMLVAKYASKGEEKKSEQATLDEAFKMYEKIVEVAVEVIIFVFTMQTIFGVNIWRKESCF
jgi:hypothetical protein